nr:MAG TPA: hypothetical protein [Bacteriophage sp.]
MFNNKINFIKIRDNELLNILLNYALLFFRRKYVN